MAEEPRQHQVPVTDVGYIPGKQ